MSEKPPRGPERPMDKEARRESHRERIRERLLWLKQENPDEYSHAVTQLHDDRLLSSSEGDVLDHMIDNEEVARRIAAALEVDHKLLSQFEHIDKEVLLASSFQGKKN